jgi:hypothetical protein
MKQRIVLYAEDGKVLTDGKIYGRQIFLADDADPKAFYEITDAEYEEILQAESEE